MESSATPAGSARVPWGRLALLLLACTLLRGYLVLAPPDDFFERGAVPHEELLRGVAAQDLLDGPLAPVQRYQVNNFWGGSLVVSIVAMAPYAVFGAKLVALRAVAVLFGVACVAILFVLLHRHAGRRAAWIGATLLAFAPPGYAMSSCTLYGTHLEANAVALLVAWLVLEEQRGRSGPAPRWLTTALGFSAGFALWFGFSLIPVLGAWVLHEFARDRLFLLRPRAVFLGLGFLAGLSPWIRYQLVHGYSGLEIYDHGFGYHLTNGIVRGQVLEKLLTTFSTTGPMSFCFRETLPVPGTWVGRALACVALAVVVRCVWNARPDFVRIARGISRGESGARVTPATFALAFLALFTVTYALSTFDVAARDWIFDLRYLMPPVPFVCLAAGLVGAELATRSARWRLSTTAGAVAIAAVCAVSTLRHAHPERYEENLAAPGTSQGQLLRFLARTFGPEPDEAVLVAQRILARREPPLCDELLAGFGKGVRALASLPATDAEGERRRAACVRTLDLVPRSLPPDAARAFQGK